MTHAHNRLYLKLNRPPALQFLDSASGPASQPAPDESSRTCSGSETPSLPPSPTSSGSPV